MLDQDPHWFAVFTSPRHEKTVASHLQVRAIDHYLPLYRSEHQWKNGSTARLSLPLFPSYIFVRLAAQELKQVFRVPGVLSIVTGTGKAPVPLDDFKIGILRSGLEPARVQPHPLLFAGQRASIRRGPLAGLEGVVQRRSGQFRIVLTLDLILRSVAVEVDSSDVEVIPGRSQPDRGDSHSAAAQQAVSLPALSWSRATQSAAWAIPDGRVARGLPGVPGGARKAAARAGNVPEL